MSGATIDSASLVTELKEVQKYLRDQGEHRKANMLDFALGYVEKPSDNKCLKYIDMIEEMFPGKDYWFEFRWKSAFGFEVTIRIEDYTMRNSIERGFGATRQQMVETGLLDDEIRNMLEAIKGKLDDVKAIRRLP
jgi:hypothetical protein